MSALHCTDDGTAANARVAPRGQIDGTGVYLTDGVFLYRVTGLVARGADEIVDVEDCYWLDVVKVSIRDLRTRRLRVVTLSTADA